MRYLRYLNVLVVGFFSVNAMARTMQTHIPIVELTFTALSKDTFSEATFRLIDDADTLDMPCTIRHRGATSTKYKKQSYAIKFKNEEGKKVDTTLLDMRSDNYWILDAMAPDKARMRNKIGMELWMDFSAKPWYIDQEPKLKNGSNGRFVEVFVNGDYRGIYNLMERVDRKQLKLKKSQGETIKGVLYKSISWKGPFFSDIEQIYNNQSGVWGGYEYEYPDVEDSLINWEPLYDAFYFAQNSSSEDFVAQASLLYDIPVFLDCYLFIAVLSARDNMGKNLYLSYYNTQTTSKLVVTPWDMDHSFGRQYDGDLEPATISIPNWGRYLYERMKNESSHFQQDLIDRYASLRSGAFSNDSLKRRFEQNFELFRSTGAGLREEERWNNVNNIALDFEAEEEYIKTWLDERLIYTDSIFQYTTPITTIDNLQDHTDEYKRPIKSIENGQIFLYKKGKKYNILGILLE